MNDSRAGAEGAPQRVVTLIHGTKFLFARNPRWVEDGQPLTKRIEGIEGTLLCRFRWRGRNRHSDRLVAAERLKAHLTKLIEDYPKASHHIVAHSHGGNVALYALDGEESLHPVQLITMGTPFLSMKEASRVLYWPLYMLALVPVAVVLTPLRLADWSTRTGDSFREATIAIAAYGLIGSLVIVALTSSLFMYWRGKPSSSLGHLISGRAVEVESNNITSPAIPPDRLSVVRAHGDEAADFLSRAQLGSTLRARVFRSLGAPEQVGVIQVLQAAMILAVLAALLGQATSVGPISAAALVMFVVVSLASTTVFLVGAYALFRTVLGYYPFGLDMHFWPLHADLVAAPAPGGPTGEGLQVEKPGAGFRHSVYDAPEAIDKIEEWIRVN